MVKDHKELVRVCGELNLNTLKDKIEVEYQKYLSGLQKIKNDALQWAKEIREQHEKMLTEKSSSTLPPRTPTLKRAQRKRKIPDVNDGKENTIAVGRKARAASQAASSKFYGQFHVPVKLRRPSDESKKQPPKRVRIASSTVDSEDDAASVAASTVSVAASTVSEKAKPTTPPRKLRSKRQAPVVESSDEGEGNEDKDKPIVNTRSKKAAAAKKTTEKKPTKKRKLAKKVDSDSEETPAPPETTNENTPNSDIASTEAELSQEYTAPKTPEEQPIKKNPALVMSRIVAIKVEKLSETFITNQINAAQEDEALEESPALTAESNVVSSESQDEAEPAAEEAKKTTPEKRRSSRNKPIALIKLPGKTPELQALTPHITGKVKERVNAVEQSLQKGYPRVQLAHADAATTSRVSPLKQTRLLKQTQDSSPDPFAGDSDNESNNSYSNLRRNSAQTASKTISASMSNLNVTGTLQKSTLLNSQVSVTKKLFEPSSSMRRRRSKSCDLSMKKVSHHSHCCSSQSRPMYTTNTLGRSRVVQGKIFMTQAMKDQAQQVAAEAEKKKEEERLLREEKLNEASKKKEELLKTRAEEKKKANEEKRNKVKLLQEQRQKELEAHQRKKEETSRLEREREDQKKNKEKEERAQKLQEMRAKRVEKKKLDDAKKAKEEELKKVKEEELKKAKEEEAKKTKEEEEEKKKLQAEDDKKKRAVEASKLKLLQMAKTLKPISEVVKSGPVPQALNSTFTKPNVDECKTPKAPHPAVSRLAQNNSYVVTPTRDELPPPLPKTDNDYGIDEVTEGDSSDDDEKPKKKVPSWAAKMRGNPQLDCADYIRPAVRNNLFGTRVFKPTITDLFGANARPMNRRSSAVWNTPPNLHHMTLNASMLMD